VNHFETVDIIIIYLILSPARAAPAITVAASDINDKSASFTNYGTCVDTYAPGIVLIL